MLVRGRGHKQGRVDLGKLNSERKGLLENVPGEKLCAVRGPVRSSQGE